MTSLQKQCGTKLVLSSVVSTGEHRRPKKESDTQRASLQQEHITLVGNSAGRHSHFDEKWVKSAKTAEKFSRIGGDSGRRGPVSLPAQASQSRFAQVQRHRNSQFLLKSSCCILRRPNGSSKNFSRHS